MRLLANENIPRVAIEALVAAGHNVVWVRSATPGLPDAEVLAWAVRENRTLLTFDKDFGDLARQAELPAACGVILLRIPMPGAQDAGSRITAIINSRNDWTGHFSVVEPHRIRMRVLTARP